MPLTQQEMGIYNEVLRKAEKENKFDYEGKLSLETKRMLSFKGINTKESGNNIVTIEKTHRGIIGAIL